MMTETYAPSAVGERIRELCRQFRLPTLAAETVDRFSDAGHADALPTLVEVLEQEAEDRRIRKVDRLRRASKLPAGKTWDTFEHERAPVKLRQQLVRLAEGDFVDRDVNVLAFGLPGTGKTHAMCAIGHRLVQDGRSVLFTLIAERYERRSLGITSNLVFSEWEKVFSNPMATAAAIDRIVHHSVILEFDMPSYRTSEAQGRQAQERQLQTTITPDPERPK